MEAEEYPLLGAIIKQWLVKIRVDFMSAVVTVNFGVCKSGRLL
jgi:hypothetical protein